MTNAEYAKQGWFGDLCDFAGLQPTTRQASKYRRKKGLAFRNHQAWVNHQHREVANGNLDAVGVGNDIAASYDMRNA